MSFSETRAGISAVVDIFDQHDLFDFLDNDDVLRLSRLGGGPGFSGGSSIRKATGISRRRLLKSDLSAADLGERLCTELTRATGLEMSEFDAVLLCHSFTDVSAADQLAGQLAGRQIAARDRIFAFNHGCAGFLKLLHTGTALLRKAGRHGRVVLLMIETPEFWHDAADRLFCGIVSAGATAVVLERDRGLPLRTVVSGDHAVPEERRMNDRPLFHTDLTEVFDFRSRPVRRTVMRMNSEPVFLNGIELMLSSLRRALATIDYSPGERIIVAPHQPSGKLLKALIAAAATEFPGVEFLNNLEFYGNTISSTVPTLLSRLDEILLSNRLAELVPGDHIILLAAGICMERIADHMSAGFACLSWQPEMTVSGGNLRCRSMGRRVEELSDVAENLPIA
ncbi:MAG: hypothetical protein KDA89_09650 [Planctomycetaceae bacterium]|nr:hypothetical protein [Planctomycetaceae bacterium]